MVKVIAAITSKQSLSSLLRTLRYSMDACIGMCATKRRVPEAGDSATTCVGHILKMSSRALGCFLKGLRCHSLKCHPERLLHSLKTAPMEWVLRVE